MLIERLAVDQTLRRLCGWERRPGTERARSRAPSPSSRIALCRPSPRSVDQRTQKDRLVGHISRDATAIEAREKPVRSRSRAEAGPKTQAGPAEKRRDRREERAAAIGTPGTMSLRRCWPICRRHCSVGTKRNAKGHTTSWTGYKLHIDTADGDIPISCLLTSASVHDSQVAMPLATITADRVTNLYDLMDSAYDAPEIHAKSIALGHVPIIDHNTQRGEKVEIETEARAKRSAGYVPAEDVRYKQRSAAERVNAKLKDNCGGNTVRVRGAPRCCAT